jgi:hypothetical protein
MKLLAISFVAWLAGLVSYVAAIKVLWHQRITYGDMPAVVFWSGLAATIAIIICYAPIMLALRPYFVDGGTAGWIVFPTLGIVLSIVPVALIFYVWSDNLARALVTPEARLFFYMFVVFGAVFGSGVFVAYERTAT